MVDISNSKHAAKILYEKVQIAGFGFSAIPALGWFDGISKAFLFEFSKNWMIDEQVFGMKKIY